MATTLKPWIAELVSIANSNTPFNADEVEVRLKVTCIFFQESEECAKRPSELLGECETAKEIPDCEEVIRHGVEQFCTQEKTSPACGWLPTTTTTANITTESSTTLFIIIGAVVGGVLILAIAIGLFFYCRRKKKLAGKKGQMVV
ncbi:hypothetical protein CRE_25845 [Caenorhabditis remanei]|uniref:Uncharacterized protein n=1 Tax=Caenorhabditis remanei TaxID=31234 RepID=E3NAA5_CAERE|nr:hypothetical protein CRE_25845 [Caenorhabditis remanei]